MKPATRNSQSSIHNLQSETRNSKPETRYDILITIDVEDWFQVENFKQYIPFSSWSSYELRVERNTHFLLDLFDSIKLLNPHFTTRNQTTPKATFFILGWLAERIPNLISEIYSRGHEIASHGYNHELCNVSSPGELEKDLSDSKKLLEDIIGNRIYGYRAPSFSINNDILNIIDNCEYLYDSSYNSFEMHGRYGKLDLLKNKKIGISTKISDTLYELPVSNINLGDYVLPWGGGGYFRMLPFSFFRLGVNTILRKKHAYLFYMHPWEVDPEQPRVNEAAAFFKFRHYLNLAKTHSKLKKFIESFKKNNFITCQQYLSRHCL